MWREKCEIGKEKKTKQMGRESARRIYTTRVKKAKGVCFGLLCHILILF